MYLNITPNFKNQHASIHLKQLNCFFLKKSIVLLSYLILCFFLLCATSKAFGESKSDKTARPILHSSPKPSQGKQSYIYRTKLGDTPESVAFDFLENAASQRMRHQFYAHNRLLVADKGKRISVNHPLTIPVAWMFLKPVNAVIVHASGQVKMSQKSIEKHFFDIPSGSQVVAEDAVIRTGTDGFVVVQLPDGSTLSITPQSELVLSALRQYASSDIFKINLYLNQGRVESSVKPLTHQASDYSIRSRRLTTGVRGTQFNVSEPANGNATSEVLEGSVSLADAAKNSKLIPKGFGSVVANDRASDLIALLEPPVWKCAKGEQNILNALPVVFKLQPTHVHVGVFLPETGMQVSEYSSLRLSGSDLPAGFYKVVVRGIDENGLRGYGSFQTILIKDVSEPSIKTWVFEESIKTWRLEESGIKVIKKYLCEAS